MLAWFIIGYKVHDLTQKTEDPELHNIAAAKKIIESKHYGEKPKMKLEHLAIRGMLYGLKDKRANFLASDLTPNYFKYINGDYGVIGISTEMEDGHFIVKSVRNDSPSKKAGIIKGDRILEIDGWKVQKDSVNAENAYRVIGKNNTTVKLLVERDNQKINFEVKRVQYQPIEDKFLEGNIGYIKQNAFNLNTSELMKESLKKILSQHPKGIIWDLRDNSGGELNTAVTIINYFLSQGNIITSKFTDSGAKTYTADPQFALVDKDIPMAVLVNASSMSAAEVSTAALMENKRAVIIGEKTFGKGTINTTYPLPDGSLLELTDGAWFSPKMKSYNITGITPEVEVQDIISDGKDQILEKAKEILAGWLKAHK